MAQHNFKDVTALDSWRQLSAPLWVFDLDQKRIWWANDSALAFWQAPSLEALVARDFASDGAHVTQRLQAIWELVPDAGAYRDVWTLYPQGQPQSVSISFQRACLDTDRRGLLIELVETRKAPSDAAAPRLLEAVQSTPSMITMMTLDGRVLVQNSAALDCFGPPATGCLSDLEQRIPDVNVVQQILASAAQNKVLRFEAEVQTRAGLSEHYVWVQRGRDPVSGDDTIVLSEEDISEISGRYRKQIERSEELEDIVEDRTDRLRITQDRMRRGLQLAAIWDWDIASNQLFFSPNFIQKLGYEKQEFYSKLRAEQFKSIIHPEDFATYPAALEDILANPDKPLSLELRFLTRSGKALWIQIEGACYCDDAGKPVRTAGLLTDITHKKQLEAQLIASQKLEAIGQLTGGIAHDFNNLLTVIQGNIQLLQEIGQADDDLTSEVVSAVQRGAELTRHLLAFAGKQSLDPAVLDVVKLLGRMRGTLLRILSEAIETVFVPQADLWPAFADATQTEAALLNIALNARDVMAKGGTLTMRAQNVSFVGGDTPPDTPLLPGDYVRISVSDTGTGMAPDVMAKAFEPFFTTKDVGKGSGLGLSMVLGFSQQSGGGTQIESAVDKGTTISVYLPRAKGAQLAASTPAAEVPQIGKGERIHVLEDNAQVISAVVRLASSLGYSVTSSTDVDSALEAALHDPSISVFLVDVVMPGGRSGVDFASELLKFRPETKLILMSGYPQEELLRDTAKTIDFGFLPKPFSRHSLSDALAEALLKT